MGQPHKDKIIVAKGKEGKTYFIENNLYIAYDFWRFIIKDKLSFAEARKKIEEIYKDYDLFYNFEQ